MSKTLFNATATPLASIFGSGFLVIVPILAGATGAYSVAAMAVICALAFGVGQVIRHNIAYAEPVLAGSPSEATLSLERGSDLALILAYIISVSLYLHILSSFVLDGIGANSPLNQNIMTTAIIAVIMAIGLTKGLDELEILERWALLVTLVIIALVLIAFATYDWSHWQADGTFALPQAADHGAWDVLTIVAGTLIVVQGFETPRYMAESYDAETRIKASRLSQIISSVIYIPFVALSLPLAAALGGVYDDNSLLKMAGLATGLLVAPLILAAALSQFSAAVADTIAAAGNMAEVTHNHLKAKWGYLIVGSGAIALTWSADTFQIVALASRAFAFYYMLQCFVAISITGSMARKVGFTFLAAALGFITVFAVPAG